MVPNDDITNKSHTCNKDMDYSIIKTTTSATGDENNLYRDNQNKYPTPATTTTYFSNICGGSGGYGASSTSDSFTMYLFARHIIMKNHI